MPASTMSTAAMVDLSMIPPPPPECNGAEDLTLLTLEDVVKDSHMHALFLQYLSVNDKKGFARLLFLVSVEEFKKLLGAHPDGTTDADEELDGEELAAEKRNHRRVYASKIISKFMSQDSFLDIASENLRILNKSVWSFGSFLRNDLMMCAGLSSKVDLFYDAEVAVRKALLPSFEQFTQTKEYADLVANARITYTLVGEDKTLMTTTSTDSTHDADATDSEEESKPIVPTPRLSMGPHSFSRSASSYLTLDRVLSNRRLCSVFWVFLFKERTHEQLSLWMDFRYQLIPLLNAFIEAAKADMSLDSGSEIEEGRDESDEPQEAFQQQIHSHAQPGELIDQVLTVGNRIAAKYLAVNAGTYVTFVGNADRALLLDYERHVSTCIEAGTFSLADAEGMLKSVQKISSVIEYNLKVNHFVRFMGSDSFRSLVSSYQSRLLSPSGSFRAPGMDEELPVEAVGNSGASSSSECSMTTLQELFHCMNVASHQPQRIRGKKFTLRDLFLAQLRGEPQSKSLVSFVMTFRLDMSDKTYPQIIKDVLHTLATKESSDDMQHHHAIPDHVEAFFCPSGADVVRSKTRPSPTLFHMTIGNSDKAFYGACLTRYVAQTDEKQLGPLDLVLRETEGMQVFVPVGLCVISRFPILDTLKKRLDTLHTSVQDDEDYVDNPHWMPSAAQMAELLAPFDFSVIASAHANSMSGSTGPSLAKLSSYVDFSMEELFCCLSIENVVALVTCMMLERQVVLVSSRYSVLTAVGETLKSLISPLVWSHVFAPILPKSMLECLQCPTPYLFGVHSSYRKELSEWLTREGSCASIVVVDLDSNTLSSAVRPQLPESVRLPLITSLQQLLRPRIYFSDYVPMCQPLLSPERPSRRFPERHVRDCFQQMVTQIWRNLEEFRFVLSDDFDNAVVFDRIAFASRLPANERAFYRSFLETQLFSHEIASVA